MAKSIAEKMGIEPWKRMTHDGSRVKEGVSRMRETLAEDAREATRKGSGFPPHHRGFIIRVVDVSTGQTARDYGRPANASLRFFDSCLARGGQGGREVL